MGHNNKEIERLVHHSFEAITDLYLLNLTERDLKNRLEGIRNELVYHLTQRPFIAHLTETEKLENTKKNEFEMLAGKMIHHFIIDKANGNEDSAISWAIEYLKENGYSNYTISRSSLRRYYKKYKSTLAYFGSL